MCAGSISGTAVVVIRSCEDEVKSVRASGSAVSVAPETKVRVCTLTLGNWLVSSSAVAVSRTRSICRVLKLPMTWPALARLPIRASMSLKVWV
ncbi:hypothetical protein D3C79_966170 [compost metagenome]